MICFVKLKSVEKELRNYIDEDEGQELLSITQALNEGERD